MSLLLALAGGVTDRPRVVVTSPPRTRPNPRTRTTITSTRISSVGEYRNRNVVSQPGRCFRTRPPRIIRWPGNPNGIGPVIPVPGTVAVTLGVGGRTSVSLSRQTTAVTLRGQQCSVTLKLAGATATTLASQNCSVRTTMAGMVASTYIAASKASVKTAVAGSTAVTASAKVVSVTLKRNTTTVTTGANSVTVTLTGSKP